MNSRSDFLRQAERKFPDFLRSIVTGSEFFPCVVLLGKSKRATAYEERRKELLELRSTAAALGFQVEWSEVGDLKFGRHERPDRAFFPDEHSYLRALGKIAEVADFRADLFLIRESIPQLESWLSSAVRKVASNHGRWPKILAAVSWFMRNPQSDLYLRQLPIPGVDTKFIESNRALIEELLDFLDPGIRGETFHSRFGLRVEEPMLRIRFLDQALCEACDVPSYADDLALPRSKMAKLPLDGVKVIIVENLRNFLALPSMRATAAVFGGGDALVHWRSVAWLASCECHYWGDIDLHGFAMLARLRSFLPLARSFLMDEGTLNGFGALAVNDSTVVPVFDQRNLTADEILICAELLKNRVRLEQERIPMPEVIAACASISHLA